MDDGGKKPVKVIGMDILLPVVNITSMYAGSC